uniref:Axin interactor, dorsalization associated n=1 Tax=Haplochromis burtoni TaxID=8153 RepID=A0A3Q2VVY2_HAPBU
MSDVNKTIQKWHASFKKGTDFDSWGQLVEAIDEYQILARQLQKEVQSTNSSDFTEEQKKTLAKIATCLEMRSASLQCTQSKEEFNLEDLKKLETIIRNVLTYNKEFPFDVQPVPLRKIFAPGEEENLELEEEEDATAGAGSTEAFPPRAPGALHLFITRLSSHVIVTCCRVLEDHLTVCVCFFFCFCLFCWCRAWLHRSFPPASLAALQGTLLPRLPSEPGMTLLTIRIEKIGLKDAGQCIDPYMTISVKDVNGVDLNPVQDTPVATRKEDTYIHFSVDVEVQRHVEKLPKGAAIFFEFKHYKPKKRFTSTKCFAFMEMDEIKPGPIVIELYKKPTDFKRKKLQLLTKKPLYLHLHQTLHKDS